MDEEVSLGRKAQTDHTCMTLNKWLKKTKKKKHQNKQNKAKQKQKLLRRPAVKQTSLFHLIQNVSDLFNYEILLFLVIPIKLLQASISRTQFGKFIWWSEGKALTFVFWGPLIWSSQSGCIQLLYLIKHSWFNNILELYSKV